MGDWLAVLETGILITLCVLALLVILLMIRRFVIIWHGGVFDCGLRRWKGDSPGGWALGMARYSGNLFKWYRMFSLSPRHSLQLRREEMKMVSDRPLDALESLQLFDDQHVIELGPVGGVHYDLSLTEPSLLGLTSWLEAAPVGYRYDVE